MKWLCAAVGVAMMTGTSVAAQNVCPTQADLQNGVRLIDTRNNNARVFVERASRLYEGRTESIDGPTTGVWWFHPHPILPGNRATQDGSFDMSYGGDIAEIDRLADGSTWTSAVTYLLDGKPHSTGSVQIYKDRPSPFSPHTLGDCEYAILTYRILQQIEGASSLEDEVYFAPELGLVVGRTYLGALSVPSGGYWFNQIALEP